MKKYRFKKSAVYLMYGLGFALLIGILVLTDSYLTVDDLGNRIMIMLQTL